ncbi:MAG TPA: transposase [Rhodanobacteraceae bacterium]|nr:transposase [Rhodanobacteraceae bacterium]
MRGVDSAALNAITDVATLRALVREQLVTIAERERGIRVRDLNVDQLTHELARLRRVQFAAKSERMDPVQRALFDNAMAADLAVVEDELAALQVPAAKPPRCRPHRRPWPAELPREEVVHEPEPAHCTHHRHLAATGITWCPRST